MSDLVPSPPQTPSPAGDSTDLAKRDLDAARERLARRLESLERSMPVIDRVRHLVRARPGLVLGGAFLLGYGLARLLRRR